MKRLSTLLAVIQIVVGVAGLLYLRTVPASARPVELAEVIAGTEEQHLDPDEKHWFTALVKTHEHLDAVAQRDNFWRQMTTGLLWCLIGFGILQVPRPKWAKG